MPVNPSSALGSGSEVVAPVGLGVKTPEQKELFQAAAEFERFFLNHMVKQMAAVTKEIGGTDDEAGAAADSSTSAYQDMANDQLVQSMLDGGGLGLASVMYGQLAEQAGVLDDTAPGPTGGAPLASNAPPASGAPGAAIGGVA